MNDALIFESLFLIFLFANIALGFYLYLREAKSIREHRNKVPHVFSGLVSLDAHKGLLLMLGCMQIRLTRFDISQI